MIFILITALFKFAIANEPLPANSVNIDPNTVFVIFGARHGNRNPDEFLPNVTRKWGQEGSLELTSIGKRQSYAMGVELRAFIGNLSAKNYNASEVKYYSSSANRCQMTLQAALAGLHPPEDWSVWIIQ
ncbi:unnamed protein product [Caenorhabditis bovis]|uniref:Uncharacterized protein n=1 Tax=Caenorhabditis bovis TaxID=2654633 RepID=A0A8S1FBE7_9PELO|nr:unnamed protein product [Caenorhabditis bovis]